MLHKPPQQALLLKGLVSDILAFEHIHRLLAQLLFQMPVAVKMLFHLLFQSPVPRSIRDQIIIHHPG